MGALLARSQPHATEVISGLILECRDGKGNREEECVKLAELWRLDVDGVRKGFATAREVRDLREEDEGVTEEAKPEPKPPKPLNGEILEGPYKGMTLLRGRILGPKPELALVPEAPQATGPLQETEVALKASAQAEAMPVVRVVPAWGFCTNMALVEPLQLDPSVPFDNAGKLISTRAWHHGEGMPNLTPLARIVLGLEWNVLPRTRPGGGEVVRLEAACRCREVWEGWKACKVRTKSNERDRVN